MTTEEADLLAPEATFGKYRIVRLLGAGGMGAVYEAVHTDLKKRVAIKTMLRAIANNKEARARFLREGEAAARIRHPHVVDVSDTGTQEGLPFIVMEYLEGESLAALLSRERALPLAQLADLMLPVLSAVHAAHLAGVLHRDLKPENIFLSRSGHGSSVHPKVLDFGISKMADNVGDNQLTKTAAMLGTASYMSPEQARGVKTIDARSDQYALGVILYEASTGVRPVGDDTMLAVLHKISKGEFDPPRRHRAELPEGFEAVVLRAMKLEPAERYPSVLALGEGLLPFASDKARVLWSDSFSGTGEANIRASVVAPTPPTAPPPTGRTTPTQPARTPEETKLGGAISSEDLFSTKGLSAGGAEVEKKAVGPADTASAAPKSGPARWPLLVGASLLAVGSLFALGRGLRGSTAPGSTAPPPPTSAPRVEATDAAAAAARYSARVSVVPAAAVLELDGVELGSGGLVRDFPRDGMTHHLRARAPGYESIEVVFRDAPPEERIELRPSARTAEPVPVVSANRGGSTHNHGPHGGSPPAPPVIQTGRTGSTTEHTVAPPPPPHSPVVVAAPPPPPSPPPPPPSPTQAANGSLIVR